jgi:hypothetical protein
VALGGLSALLRTKAVRKGLIGGSRGWMVVGVVVYGWKALRWLSARNPELVSVERIEPGQTVQITTVAAPTRRERRAAKRR